MLKADGFPESFAQASAFNRESSLENLISDISGGLLT